MKKCFEAWTIVPVGTKIVRHESGFAPLTAWNVYTVKECTKNRVYLEEYDGNYWFCIEYFYPLSCVQIYIPKKNIPILSENSVIVNSDWVFTFVGWQLSKNIDVLNTQHIFLEWLINNHEEDFDLLHK